MTARALRPHQIDAADAIEATWAAGHRRALVVMACGTGKTLVGIETARRLNAALVAVYVPSLALVRQTIDVWRNQLGDHLGDIHVVGTEHGLVHAELTAHAATTDPDLLAIRLHQRQRDKTTLVVCTYHSAAALGHAQRRSHPPLTFDLAICDEAHHLAWTTDARFAAARDDIDATHKLHLTATPVTTGTAAAGWVPVRGTTTMTDTATFGPVAYQLTLSDARDRGLLTDWKVLVRDGGDDADPVAAATAVLRRVAAEHQLRRVMLYTNRVADAHRAAATLNTNPTLGDGRQVHATVVDAATPPSRRAAAIARLGRAETDLEVICNVDCLSEGVDVPALDAVVFAHGRHSRIAITQILGRVLRRHPGKEHGYVILPVPVGDDPDTDLAASAYATIWATCRALRDIDESFAAALDTAARRLGQGSHTGALPGVDIELPATVADTIVVRSVETAADRWWYWYGRLETAVADGEHPTRCSDPTLRTWCAAQRRAHHHGVLTTSHKHALEHIRGWAWTNGFSNAAAALDTLAAHWPTTDPTTGHSGPPATIPGWGRRTDALIAWARIAHHRQHLGAHLAATLQTLPGWDWQPYSHTDAAALSALDRYRAWEGHTDVPADHVENGVELGQAVRAWQLERLNGTLPAAVEAGIEAASHGKFRWNTEQLRWETAIGALAAWCATHGHSRRIGDTTVDTAAGPLRIGQWVNRIRFEHRAGTLDATRAEQLEQIPGWSWDAHDERHERDVGTTAHGTRTGYVKGCRCDRCTNANVTYNRARQQIKDAGGPTTDLVDAAAAAADLQRLNAAGLGTKIVAELLGLSASALQMIAAGKRHRVSPRTRDLLAGANPDTLFDAIVEQAGTDPAWAARLVPAAPTLALIDTMVAAGWPKRWIAQEAGLGNSIQLGDGRIAAGKAARIATLARTVATLTPPARPARQPFPPLDDILARTPAPAHTDRTTPAAP